MLQDCLQRVTCGRAGSVLVIDGLTLDWALQPELQSDFLELTKHCKAVICCRSTPLQKSQVVRLVRDKLKVMTLAVGKNNTVLTQLTTCIQYISCTSELPALF